jgi:hypothetical protein
MQTHSLGSQSNFLRGKLNNETGIQIIASNGEYDPKLVFG